MAFRIDNPCDRIGPALGPSISAHRISPHRAAISYDAGLKDYPALGANKAVPLRYGHLSAVCRPVGLSRN